MYKVLLVDDETMLLDSLEIILSLNNMEITGKAHDGNEALAVLEKTKCDIALVDLNMKGMGGIELIGYMKKLYPDIRILVLTTFYDDTNITDAISNGADGYLLKDSGKDAILGAVNQIMGGNTVLDQRDHGNELFLGKSILCGENKKIIIGKSRFHR
jgi:DNA-binding NarL/FixJ family response regulator